MRTDDNQPSEMERSTWETFHKGSWNSVVAGIGKGFRGFVCDLRFTYTDEIGILPLSNSYSPICATLNVGYKLLH